MNRYITLLLILLLTPMVLAQANVSIQAPTEVMPGETLSIEVETTIQGVRIISVPTSISVLWPDDSVTTLDVEDSQTGVYSASLYAPLLGEYQIRANAQVAGENYTTIHELRVAQPSINATIRSNATHVLINSSRSRLYQIRVFTPRAGVLSEMPITCSIECASCQRACPIPPNQLALVTTTQAYTYDYLLSSQDERNLSVEPAQKINTSGWYRYDQLSLTSLPTTSVFTQDQVLIDSQGRIVNLAVVEDQSTLVRPIIAYDSQTGAWYALYAQNTTKQARINQTIEDAWTLQGNQLEHTSSRINPSSGFEARIRTQQLPPQLPEVQNTEYGSRISFASDAWLRLSEPNAIRLQGPNLSYEYYNTPQNTSVYYASESHLRINATPIRQNYLLSQAGDTIQLTPPNNTVNTRIVNSDLLSVRSEDQPIRTWLALVPAGKYFALHTTPNSTYLEAVELLSQNQRIQVSPNETYTGSPNTQLGFSRTVRNADSSSPRTIDVFYESGAKVLLADSSGTRLTDTNLNGIPDTGLLAPGEEFTLQANVLIPPKARDFDINWSFQTQNSTTNATDSVQVTRAEVVAQNDLAITQLSSENNRVILEVYNFDQKTITTPVRIDMDTLRGEDSARFSVTAPPGVSTHSYQLITNTTYLQATLQIEDERAQNNRRFAHTSPKKGLYVEVNERRSQDHDRYRVRVQAPLGDYQALFPLVDGSFKRANSSSIRVGDEQQELIIELPLASNTDSFVLLSRGNSSPIQDLYQIIDNSDTQVFTTGRWIASSQVPGYFQSDYLTDLDSAKAQKFVEYTPQSPGIYEVSVSHPGDPLFASNTRIQLGETTIFLNQQKPNEWKYLGRYELDSQTPITVSNQATDGFVVADAFRLLRVDQYSQLLRQQADADSAPQFQNSQVLDTSQGFRVVFDLNCALGECEYEAQLSFDASTLRSCEQVSNASSSVVSECRRGSTSRLNASQYWVLENFTLDNQAVAVQEPIILFASQNVLAASTQDAQSTTAANQLEVDLLEERLHASLSGSSFGSDQVSWQFVGRGQRPGIRASDSATRQVGGIEIYSSKGTVVRANLPNQSSNGLFGIARASNELELEFPAGPISRMSIADGSEPGMRLGIEPVKRSRAQQFVNTSVRDAFAINPEFSSDYTITKRARGSRLLKCTDYEFSTQTCNGEFSVVGSITPGEEYSFTFTPEDPLFVEDDWWNSSFELCRNIQVPNIANTALSDYPVPVVFDIQPAMQNDLDDVRFVNASCATGGSAMTYDIESSGGTSAVGWVLAPTLPASGANYSMYYGNNSVGSAADAATVWNNFGINYYMDEFGLDTSPNNRDVVSVIGTQPDNSVLGLGRSFNGFSDGFEMSNIAYWENAWNVRSHEVVFTTSSDITTRQAVFAEGGTVNGAMLFIDSGSLYVRYWSESSGWNGARVNIPIVQDTTYHAVARFEHPNFFDLIVNTVSSGSQVPPTSISGHSGDGGIGYTNTDKDFLAGDTSGSPAYFDGSIHLLRTYDSTPSYEWVNVTYDLLFGSGVTVDDPFSVPEVIQASFNETTIFQDDSVMLNATIVDPLGNEDVVFANATIVSPSGTKYVFPLTQTVSLNNSVTSPDAESSTISIVANDGDRVIGEGGSVNLSNFDSTLIAFERSYASTPIVIATPASDNNGDNGLAPVINQLNRTHLNISLCEDAGATTCDVNAPEEELHYMVFDVDEADRLDWIDVGVASGPPDDSSVLVSFDQPFGSTPYVFTTVQSDNDGGSNIAPVITVDSVSTTGATLAPCAHPGTENSCSGSTNEDLGWVAIDFTADTFAEVQSGFESIGNSNWASISFSPVIANPIIAVTKNTENGGEDGEYPQARNVAGSGADIRYCEADAAQTCDNHNDEDMVWSVFPAGNLSVTGTQSNESDSIWYPYDNVDSTTLSIVKNLTVSVSVSDYNSTASTNNGNQPIDLEVGVATVDGSGYVSLGELSVSGPGLYSVSTQNTTVLEAWSNPNARDLRVRAVDSDYDTIGGIADRISWDQVYVDIDYDLESSNWYATFSNTSEIGVFNLTSIYAQNILGNAVNKSQTANFTVLASVNEAPTIDAVVLNSTYDTNLTDENLTAHPINVSDVDGDSVRNTVEWLLDSQSITPILVPMSIGNSTQTRDYSRNSTFSVLDGATFNESGGPDGLGRYSFDGTDDALQDLSAGASLNGLSEFSMSVWVNSDVTNVDNGILLGRNPDGTDTVFGLRYDASGFNFGGTNLLKVGLSTTGGDLQTETSSNSQTTGWQHIVVRWSSGDPVDVFLDGSYDTPTGVDPVVSGTITGADRLLIGRGAKYGDTSNGWQGNISRVRIFNRSLSDEQIQMLYQEGLNASRNPQIASQETSPLDEWQACITPSDGFLDGPRVCSNLLRVGGGFVEPIAPNNGSIIDRDGLGGGNQSINLTASTFGDANVNVSFYADLTDPFVAGQQNLLLGIALSNSSGYATLTYNPNESIYAGNYTWRPEIVNRTTIGNQTYLVYGSLLADYNSSINPNASYNQTQTARFLTNVSTPGPETNLDLNNTQNFSFEQRLTLPNSTNITLTSAFSNPLFSSNFTFAANETPGIWNTSVAIAARFFYDAWLPLRNFTLSGATNIDVFDQQDVDNNTVWTTDPIQHYANWTYLDGASIDNGTCTLTLWDGAQKNLTYQSGANLWTVNHTYPFAGIFRYNVSCQRPFYYSTIGFDNISISTNVSLLADYSYVSVGADTQEITLTVLNAQNHTEGNVSLFTLIDDSLTPAYSLAPNHTQVLPQGIVAEWNWLTLGPLANQSVVFNTTGAGDWSAQPVLGVRSPSASAEVFG